jgi:hypothetical protein
MAQACLSETFVHSTQPTSMEVQFRSHSRPIITCRAQLACIHIGSTSGEYREQIPGDSERLEFHRARCILNDRHSDLFRSLCACVESYLKLVVNLSVMLTVIYVGCVWITLL